VELSAGTLNKDANGLAVKRKAVRFGYAGDSQHVAVLSVRSVRFANLDKANRTYGVCTLKGSQHELYGGN
jgi:hypothetical protein